MTIPSIIKIFPDTYGYEGYANIILENSAWLHQADLNTFYDPTLHRMLLYPLIIALGKFLLGGKNWIYFVALIQFLALTASTFSILALINRLGFRRKEKILVITAYLTGLPLLLSFSILTDSLFTSFGVICLCSLSIYLLEEENKKNQVVLLLSLILISFLRESSFYYAITLLPFSLYFLFKHSFRKTFKCILIILVPVLLSQALVKSWNYYRTGDYILTTGLATALVAPQIDFIGAHPEHRNELTLANYLSEKQEPSFTDGVSATMSWMEKEKLTTPKVIEILKRDFYKTFLLYPRESLYICWKRIPLDIAFLEINPSYTFQGIFDPLGTKSPRLSSIARNSEKLDSYSVSSILHMILLNIFRLISVFVFLFGIFKTFERVCYLNQDPKNYIYASLFVQSIMWIVLHGVFHLEIRYIATSIFIFTLLGISPRLESVTQVTGTIHK
jgi:hypothetical protein